MYRKRPISISDPETFFKNARDFFADQEYVAYLDSNGYQDTYSKYQRILACGAEDVVTEPFSLEGFTEPGFRLKLDQLSKNDWWFGYLSYDLKNCFEHLRSDNSDENEADLLCFFKPQWVFVQTLDGKIDLYWSRDTISVSMVEGVLSSLSRNQPTCLRQSGRINSTLSQNQSIQEGTACITGPSRQRYLEQVSSLLDFIQRGDIYEVNYCVQFLAKDTGIDMTQLHSELLESSSPPFSVYLKTGVHEVSSLSPERYLCKRKNKLISQPIKGTARRGNTEEEDKRLKIDLGQDPKELSENTMIVDLVRNDLSKVATKGSVNVDELCTVYTFPQVHQMISTISCELKPDAGLFDLLRATFPMGSMTGAPKISAMKLIEEHEDSRRGIYSGAIGFLSPDGDFDFNVVIRSVVHNLRNNKTSFHVGSAITALSQPEKEYEECMIKAAALLRALKNQGVSLKEDIVEASV